VPSMRTAANRLIAAIALLCFICLLLSLLPGVAAKLEKQQPSQQKQQKQEQQQRVVKEPKQQESIVKETNPKQQQQQSPITFPDAEDEAAESMPDAETFDEEPDFDAESAEDAEPMYLQQQQKQQPQQNKQQKLKQKQQEAEHAELQARIQVLIDNAVKKQQEREKLKKQQGQQKQKEQQKQQEPQKQQKVQQPHKPQTQNKIESVDVYTLKLGSGPVKPEAEDAAAADEAAAAASAASSRAEQPPQESAKSPEPTEEAPEKFMTHEEVRAQQLFEDGQRILNATRSSSQTALLAKAFQYLAQAAALNHTKAMEMTALGHLFGEGVRLDLLEAERIFHRLAELGNPRGQLGLAFLHSQGLTKTEPASPAKALLYLTFSAIGGDPFGQMALAYRYWAGLGVETSCETALLFYQQVARLVADKVKPWASPAVLRIRLLDDETAPNGQTGALDDDLIQYYQFLADKGDVNAQVGLGQLYFQGGRGVPVNHMLALNYFKLAAQSGNANAMAYLGKMYAGDSSAVTPSNKTALQYFTSAAQSGNAIGYAGLGLMHLQGRGVPASPQKAEEFFGRSAELGYAEGQLQLGLMHYTGITQAGIRDLKKALKYFTLASQQGNTLAFFYLAQMHAAGSGVLRSCQTAAELYKNVAERGRWSDQLMEAHRLYKEESGSAYAALLRYLFLADSGYEVAQSNAAYILDQNPEAFFPANESYSRARQLWSRAAGQSYAQARLKLADYHYYGLGGPANLEQAASLYRAASDQQSNAQAMFNLAYMYERGLGLERDLHLAKRYYDQAAEASADAYMPVMLALCRLAVEFVMDYLRGGNYSVADLISLLSFSNFWPSATLPPPEQQRAGQHQAGQAAYDEDGESPDSANQQRQYSMAAGSRSWDSLLLTVLVGMFVYLLIRFLNRAANRREAGAAAPGQNRNNNNN
ncbi:hypothetical protein BOX15_Mlig010284g1, partial [Macrostomum lignano]